jgi:hypothetical protein
MHVRSTASVARQAPLPWLALQMACALRPACIRVAWCAMTLSACTSMPARAVDGCLVLLCLAAPSWREVPMCVPPIRQLFRDLARGKPFPICKDGGPANSSSFSWAVAPDNCPPQYTHAIELEAGFTYLCDFTGVIQVDVNGAPFTRTWWRIEGETVTDFSPAAKAQLGTWDPRFDADFAAWLASQPPSLPLTSP